MTLLKPDEIVDGTYKVKVRVGRGSFGEVYRVNHKHMGTQVLKVFHEEYVDRSEIETIMAEAKVLTKLTHPNVVRVYEANSFKKNGKTYHYITMEFVSGEPLSRLWDRKSPLPMPIATKLQREILSGLRAAHDHAPPIIHRDVNGDNILLSREEKEPQAKLADFGLAEVVDDASWSGGTAGRYGYFAHECFHGIYQPSSDVFAAGIVFYRMVTGMFPWKYDFSGSFDDPEKMETAVLRARKKDPVEPSVYNPGCGRKVEEIILQSLEKDMGNRFHNAGEFLRALDEKASRRRSAPAQSVRRERVGENQSSSEIEGGLKDVAGMEDLKEMLRNDVIGPLEDRKLYEEYKVSIPNGLLLYGPPGCGKTYIARKFAVEVGYQFIEVKPSDVGSKYIHGAQEKIAGLFKKAKENAPTILFIDELDALMPSRDQDLHHGHASEVNEFLAQMTDCSQNEVFVIGASNRPEKIDPAILRTGRMDKVVYLPPPDQDARVAMFELHLKGRPCEENLDFGKCAELTTGYVASDIKFIVEEAARGALKNRSQIGNDHLRKVIRETAPSVSNHQLSKYETFAGSRSFS